MRSWFIWRVLPLSIRYVPAGGIRRRAMTNDGIVQKSVFYLFTSFKDFVFKITTVLIICISLAILYQSAYILFHFYLSL